MKTKELIALTCVAFLAACSGTKSSGDDFLSENIKFAHEQIGHEIKTIEESGKVLNPVTLKKDGSTFYCNYGDWRSGFFPGSVWYLYELTGDKTLLPLAYKYTEAIEQAKTLTNHHDVGFIIECSFGNGLRLTNKKEYEAVIIEAAKSLSTRFREKPGIIQSWNVDRGWQSERGWNCPVIIDNMMNLQLMFHATKLTGDSSFYKIAISHADRTMQEQFREDGSCYHVIDYDLETGEVRNRHTAQGYAHESAWSRGQAWAIYGYIICYRETGDCKYLDQAVKAFNFMKNHPDMPADLVPYWDMSAPNIPNELRDVSSASCIASALYELSTMDVENASSYKAYADKMMTSLASPTYRAKPGENGNFLLMHSVGSIPHNAEIDVPLNYADYYFMEALKRKKDIETK
ncbi:glycoside hydrolase family 88 protein [Massilibacteroides sp.]|uniref:glycoside hydrolase family 88 protein n=1 Tax=Massilibacteroides sp. TaxID=2034766 RepID=UPI0026286D49|nr:glycoside hydrolase family 88 protein [Massilibacteroides sp.]MDD4515911.1 glycoside hydrolase family 88 protein [Massilibacteroides sp.]